MRAAWRHGWRFALQSGGLVLSCFAFNAALGGLCLVLLWIWFGAALDDGLATRSLLADLDPHVWLDLLANQSARIMAGAQQLAVLASLGLVVSVWVNGVLASAVGSPERRIRPHGRSALRALPRLLTLATGIGVAQLVVLVAALCMARWLTHRLADGASELTVICIWAATGGAALLLATVLLLAHDHARLRLLQSERGAVASLLWAVRFLRARGGRATLLLAFFIAPGLLLAVCHVQLSAYLPTTSTMANAASLVLAEVVLFVRLGMRTALYAAEWRLQAQFDRQG